MSFAHWLVLSRQRRTVLFVGLAVAVIGVVAVVALHDSGGRPSATPSATPSHSGGLLARESGGVYPVEAQVAVDQLETTEPVADTCAIEMSPEWGT